MKIAVAGGTGTVGRHIVRELEQRGHEPVVVARSAGVDLRTGAGLEAALDGVETVIDAASVTAMKDAAAIEFFQTTATTLLRAAERTGVRHAVLLSIVGIDRNPHGYYAGKVAQERVYEGGVVPWSILRATQFHEFAGQVAGQAKIGPLQLGPRARVQPVAAATVAERIVDLAEGAASGRATDIAGPHEESLPEMIRALRRHQDARGPVVPVSLPGGQMKGMREGLALPGPDALLLGPRFDEWLAAQPR